MPNFAWAVICTVFSAGSSLAVGPVQTDAEVPLLFPIVRAAQWGFIDRSGKVRVEPQFAAVLDRETGTALVMQGVILFEPEYTRSSSFPKGLEPVQFTGPRGKWGYIDPHGLPVIPPQFDRAYGFSEGVAAVVAGGHYGYADRMGRMVIAPRYDDAQEFCEGLARITIGDKMGFINARGDTVLEPELDWAWSFSEGLAAFQSSSTHQTGYVDRNGKIVIDARFNLAGRFREGLAPAGLPTLFGFIDRRGEVAVPPAYLGVRGSPRAWRPSPFSPQGKRERCRSGAS